MASRFGELVAAGVDAFNRRDVEASVALMDPDVELVPLRAVLEGTTFHGHDGVREFFERVDDDWEVFQLEVSEVDDLGPHRVLTLGRLTARGRASGVSVDATGAWVTDVRNGKITRLRFYSDRDQAVEAEGI